MYKLGYVIVENVGHGRLPIFTHFIALFKFLYLAIVMRQRPPEYMSMILHKICSLEYHNRFHKS